MVSIATGLRAVRSGVRISTGQGIYFLSEKPWQVLGPTSPPI